jgi:hypothetical protein
MPSGCAPLSLQGLGLFFTGGPLGIRDLLSGFIPPVFDVGSARFYEKIVTRMPHPMRFADRATAVVHEHENRLVLCVGLS